MVAPTEGDESDGGEPSDARRASSERRSDGGTDEADDGAASDATDDGRRMVEAGAGADVPVDDEAAPETDDDAEDGPENREVVGDGGGTDAAGDDETVTFEDIAGDDGEDDPDDTAAAEDPERPADGDADDSAVADPADAPGDDGGPIDFGGDSSSDDAADGAAAGADEAGSETPTTGSEDAAAPDGAASSDDPSPRSDAVASADEGGDGDDGDDDADDGPSLEDVPPELRQLLADDDASLEDLQVVTDEDDGQEADAGGHTVAEHRPDEPTDLARPEREEGDLAAAGGSEEAEAPAAETEPVSMRSEMSPALAERQAFLSLLLALGAGALFATVGNVLRLSRWQTVMLLVSAGIVVLLIATFVVFRAMLAAAERNDEPYKTAYTHPLFMFLFGTTTVVTALFVGYVSRLVT